MNNAEWICAAFLLAVLLPIGAAAVFTWLECRVQRRHYELLVNVRLAGAGLLPDAAQVKRFGEVR